MSTVTGWLLVLALPVVVAALAVTGLVAGLHYGEQLIACWAARSAGRRERKQAAATAGVRHACNRCRTGQIAFACTCGTFCHTAVCAGWLGDLRRDVIGGNS